MMRCAAAMLVVILSIMSLTAVMGDERAVSKQNPVAPAVGETAETPRPSSPEARRQAELLHTTIHSTLQAVHHGYYRVDEGLPIPAAVLKDVFAELEKEHHVKLRWLVVEGQPMNTDHKAKGPFEDEAVLALKGGKREFERVEDGVYRRAGAITLTNQCLKCHVPDRKSTANRTAGLIISIPIKHE